MVARAQPRVVIFTQQEQLGALLVGQSHWQWGRSRHRQQPLKNKSDAIEYIIITTYTSMPYYCHIPLALLPETLLTQQPPSGGQLKLAFALCARPGWLVERVIGAVADRVKAARFELAFSHPPTDYDGATRVAILSMPRRLEPFAAFLAKSVITRPPPVTSLALLMPGMSLRLTWRLGPRGCRSLRQARKGSACRVSRA